MAAWIVRASMYREGSPFADPREERVEGVEFMLSAIDIARKRWIEAFGYDWLSLCMIVRVDCVAITPVDAVEAVEPAALAPREHEAP